MMLARVIGRVWATAKNQPLDGKKMLVLQPVDAKGHATGRPVVAVDAVGAGASELVYYCRGRESSFPWLPDEVPVDFSVVGIIDQIDTAVTGDE
jgi:ethanolamine utilization protein EutN